MDAGVPLKSHVAGISIGICTEYGADHAISRYQLLTDIETGGARGMRTLDSDLLALFFQGTVSEEEVFNYCQNPEAMRERMRGGAAAR
jgi:hypothetical protein